MKKVIIILFLGVIYCNSGKAFVVNQEASIVIGQTLFSEYTSGTTDSRLSNPVDVFYDGSKLFVSDHSNNRILIFNSIPTTNGTAADVVIGQPNMNSNTINNGGISDKTLYNPKGVFSDGIKLYIADFRNNRVLIFNNISTSEWTSADVVVGQPDFISNLANQGNGSCAANTLNGPNSVFVQAGKLYITDLWNNRVIIYNSIPNSNNALADYVIGQTNLSSSSPETAANKLRESFSVFSDGNDLLIADTSNHRVLFYEDLPVASGAYADIITGQKDV